MSWSSEYRVERKRKFVEELSNEVARKCSQCFIEQAIKNFHYDRANCKTCDMRRREIYHNSLMGCLSNMTQRMRSSALHRKKVGRLQAGICELTRDDLLDIYNKQNGYCYYFKTKKMNFERGSEWMISDERLNNADGYKAGNVVLCCLEFNNRAQWSLQKINNIINLRQQDVNVSELEKALISYPIKPEYEKARNWRRDTIRRFIETLYFGSKGNAKKRKGEAGLHELTIEDVIKIAVKQKGRCYYSGIPLSFQSKSDWQASLERLIPIKGYIDGNVVLICLEFNSTITKAAKRKGGIGAQWNKDKFQDFLIYLYHPVR